MQRAVIDKSEEFFYEKHVKTCTGKCPKIQGPYTKDKCKFNVYNGHLFGIDR